MRKSSVASRQFSVVWRSLKKSWRSRVAKLVEIASKRLSSNLRLTFSLATGASSSGTYPSSV